MKEDKTCPTAYTNGKMIGYNPAFMNKHTNQECEGVFAHEVLHIVFLHMYRLNGRNPFLWNIACDYVINAILKENGFTLPTPHLYDKKWDGMSAEQVYAQMMKELEESRKNQKQKPKASGGKKGDQNRASAGGQGDPGEEPGEQEGSNIGTGSWEDVMKALNAGGDAIGQDLRAPQEESPAAAEQAQREIGQKVAAAANLARMAGKLTGSLERLLGDMLNPKVPWQHLLREYFTVAVPDDESWSRRNRRFSSVVLPSRYSERMGEIIFIGDTSGSISNDELGKGATEVLSCAEAVKPERIRLVWADTEVKNEQVFEYGEIPTFDPKGGGGTDMRVPLEYVEKFEPMVVVLMTDGHTPWPSDVSYPLIVLCTTDVEPPIGKLVKI